MAVILISIDHKWRDLPGYVYAGLLLEECGHNVHYVRNGLERFYIPTIRPDLVLWNHLRDKEKQEYAKQLKNSGVLVAIMPTEGIPTLEGVRKVGGGVYDDLSGVAMHFVWNQPMKDILFENTTINQDQVVVIGVPRFDFYRPPLTNSLQKKMEFCVKYKLNPEFPIVTLATNFTQASFYTKNQDFFLHDATKLGYKAILEEMMGGDALEVAKKDYVSRDIVISAFVRLVKETKNVNYLLKLHPSEDHQFYESKLNDFFAEDDSRVRILSNEYIWDVLNVTDIELKRSCTTGVEAWLLEKPTIEVKLNPEEHYFSVEHASGSDVVNSYEELKNKVGFYLNGGKISRDLISNRSEFINKWCHSVNGHATARMVEVLDLLLGKKKQQVTIRSELKKSTIGKLLRLYDWWLHDVRTYGLKNTLIRNYVDKLGRIDKQFHDADIALWKRKINTVMKLIG